MGSAEEASALLRALVVDCKVPAVEAMRMIPGLFSAGVKSREDLAAMEGKALERCVLDVKMRRRIVAGLKRKAGTGGRGGGEQKRKGGELEKVEAEEGNLVGSGGKRGRSGVGTVKADVGEEEPERSSMGDEELGKLDVVVNRSPVMVLWAAAVARQRGYEWPSALSLAQAASDWYAQKKGEYYGILHERKEKVDLTKLESIELVGVSVYVTKVVGVDGSVSAVRALDTNGEVIPPSKPGRYIARNFGSHIGAVYDAFLTLASTMPAEELSEGSSTYKAYEKFRPNVAKGAAGWGSRSRLKTEEIIALRDIYSMLATEDPKEETKDEIKVKAKTEPIIH